MSDRPAHTLTPSPAIPDTVRVPCRDALDRPAELTVVRRGHRLTLLAPPGQAATLDPAGLAVLADALTSAYADHNHTGRADPR